MSADGRPAYATDCEPCDATGDVDDGHGNAPMTTCHHCNGWGWTA